MQFHPTLAAAILAGAKTETRRRTSQVPTSPWWAERCKLRQGGIYAVQPGRGRKAVATIILTEKPFRERLDPSAISDETAFAEGFRDGIDAAEGFSDSIRAPRFVTAAEAFGAFWQDLYGNLDPVDVWVIRFKLHAVWDDGRWNHHEANQVVQS